MSRAQAESLCGMFAEFRPTLAERALADFSRLKTGAPVYCELAPRTADAAARIVQKACRHGAALRTRAQGHSLNGASLPQASELLLSSRNLRQVRFEEPGTVTAGAGVVLWVLQYLLRRQGFELPVVNDGYPGPSVGGFLAAGGFGPRSSAHGGYWDNVAEVRLLDGDGQLRRVTADDPHFPWLFGSMGQLGVFVEVKLDILPVDPAAPQPYPLGLALAAPRLVSPEVPPEFAEGRDEGLFWFTLFVPDEHLDAALADLAGLEREHGGALRFQERYRYPIRHRGRVAPLVYPQACPFTATGAWGWLSDSSPGGLDRLYEFDGEFMALAQCRPYYRRYVQSELASSPEVYERCLGAEIYGAFCRLKSELDPRGVLNRGTVFPAP